MTFRKIEFPSRFYGIGIIVAAVLISATAAFSHGGKHADKDFTHLQALQKATEMYDQLIDKGKLDPSWETGLVKVMVSNRRNQGKKEIVVSFHRATGEPNAVYIFFDENGKYAGSNFSGK